MCLAVPGRIVEITDNGLFRMARVDFCGVEREACIDTVEASVGDYIVVHAGVAISVMDADEAQATIDDLNRMADYHEENGL